MTWLAYGIGLGLGVGVTPGPLLALVLANSLRGGLRSGIITSLAPLSIDVIIISLSLTLMHVMPVRMVAVLGVAGGLVVIGIAADAVRVARHDDPVPQSAAMRRAFSESAIVYVLSPFPWLFWLTAGGALLSTAYKEAPSHALWFLFGFYLLPDRRDPRLFPNRVSDRPQTLAGSLPALPVGRCHRPHGHRRARGRALPSGHRRRVERLTPEPPARYATVTSGTAPVSSRTPRSSCSARGWGDGGSDDVRRHQVVDRLVVHQDQRLKMLSYTCAPV